MLAAKRQRLEELEQLLDDNRLPKGKYGEFYRLRQQVINPTPRQMIHGFKPGRLEREDEEFFQVLEGLDKITLILRKERRGD